MESRTFYTLEASVPGQIETEGYGKEFDSFEEAYDAMCKLYFEQQKASNSYPTGIPKRYGIYRTQITTWNGKTNSMKQPVWSA